MLEEKLMRFAAEHDCIAGICEASPLEEERKRLLAAQTPFVSRNIDKRISPRMSLPKAKSVIVFGKAYTPSPFKNLSSLAYGLDYHIRLRDILQKLAHLLDCAAVMMVDSGPLAERAFAVKAGLGFWGRNGMVISPLLGSFFNIGLLLVDIALRPSNHEQIISCPKDCRLCLDACPSGALKPYSVKASTCISYLTQKKIDLTEEKEEKSESKLLAMAQQLYGCDLCQISCPFNARAILPTSQIDPTDILAMDEATFETRFAHTAMAWRGLQHLQRNAKIVLNKQYSKGK